jgi:hypothetical protein
MFSDVAIKKEINIRKNTCQVVSNNPKTELIL